MDKLFYSSYLGSSGIIGSKTTVAQQQSFNKDFGLKINPGRSQRDFSKYSSANSLEENEAIRISLFELPGMPKTPTINHTWRGMPWRRNLSY